MDKILIIEDDFIIAYDLQQVLSSEGYMVDVVNTYIEALRYKNINSIDLIICDINLGNGPSGVDFIELIQNESNYISFIYLTAYSDTDILERASKTNPLNYLLKPWTKTQISIAVKLALQQNNIKKTLEKNIHEIEELNILIESKFLTNAKLTSIALHDIRSPISFLQNYVKQIMSNIGKTDISSNLKVLEDVSFKISKLNDDIFTWIKYSNGSILPNITTINLSQLLNEININYISIININNNTVKLDIIENIYIESDINLLKIIVRNVLDNAFKYTNSGTIHIKLFHDQNLICLNILDSGAGFNYSDLNTTNISINNGLGFKLIHEFSQLLNIKVSFFSELNIGSNFTLYFKN